MKDNLNSEEYKTQQKAENWYELYNKQIYTIFLLSMFVGTIWTVSYFFAVGIFPDLTNVNLFGLIITLSILSILPISLLLALPFLNKFTYTSLNDNNTETLGVLHIIIIIIISFSIYGLEYCYHRFQNFFQFVIVSFLFLIFLFSVLVVFVALSIDKKNSEKQTFPNQFSGLYFLGISSFGIYFSSFWRSPSIKVEKNSESTKPKQSFLSQLPKYIILVISSCGIYILYFFLGLSFISDNADRLDAIFLYAASILVLFSLIYFVKDNTQSVSYTLTSLFIIVFFFLVIASPNKTLMDSLGFPFQKLKLGNIEAYLTFKNSTLKDGKYFIVSSIGSEYIVKIKENDNSTAFYRIPREQIQSVRYQQNDNKIKEKSGDNVAN